jgi:hypothetical protein
VHESLVRLGTWLPFEAARQLLEALLGVQVSKSQAVRCTEAAGAAYVTLQSAAADQIEQEAPPAATGNKRMVVSADGAMIPLRGGEWGEVKILAIGAVQTANIKSGEKVVRTRQISYFSRLTTAEQFEHLSLVEMHRRGIENSAQVAAVMDGAEWLQRFIDYHCPQAVRILDFPQAGQRIGQVGQAPYGEGTAETKQWTADRLHQLKHQGPQPILTEFGALQEKHPELPVVAENRAYLEKRVAQMQYPSFQQQGWPIGSGMVESGNKLVVEARLKGAGMHWARPNVNGMLGLRNIVCSDRWSQEWSLIADQLRRQARDGRKQQRQQRRLDKAPPVSEPMPVPEPVLSCQQPAKEKPAVLAQPDRPRKPAPNHPWRHSPVGRRLYQPSENAKD